LTDGVRTGGRRVHEHLRVHEDLRIGMSMIIAAARDDSCSRRTTDDDGDAEKT
jgi:hypothetical protein